MAAVFLSLAVVLVLTGKTATLELTESVREGRRFTSTEQPIPASDNADFTNRENLENTTFFSYPKSFLSENSSDSSDFLEETTIANENGQSISIDVYLEEIQKEIGKISNDSAKNSTNTNQSVDRIGENLENSVLNLTENQSYNKTTQYYFHFIENFTVTIEDFSSTTESGTEHGCLKTNSVCHCTTTQTEPRNHSKVLEDFRRMWPVDKWLAQGFFTEEFLLRIPVHWLTFPPPAPEAHYFLAAAYMAVMVVGVAGNLMVIIMFCRCKSLKTPANILVMNLAFSDLMMLIKMPVFIYNSIQQGPALGEIGCQIYGFIGGLTGTVSIATLAAIGLDRYYVIVHPLDPLRRTTRMRARLCVAFVWLYGLTFSALPLTELKLSRYVPEGFLTSCSFDYLDQSVRSRSFILVFFTAAWVIPFLVLTFSYLAICHVVVHAREVPPGGDSSRHCRENDKRRTELRLAEVVLGVVGLWFISWTPYAVVALLGVSGNQHLLTPLGSMVPALLAKMASAVDPYVYAINHPRFRMELTKSWNRWKGQPQFRASQARSVVVTMHEPTVHSSNSSHSDDFQMNALQPQEQEPEATGKPVDLPISRRYAGLLPPTWFRPPKPKRNRSTSLRLKSRVKDVQEKTVFYSYSETRLEKKNDVE